jgi:hypothetical protein
MLGLAGGRPRKGTYWNAGLGCISDHTIQLKMGQVNEIGPRVGARLVPLRAKAQPRFRNAQVARRARSPKGWPGPQEQREKGAQSEHMHRMSVGKR